ncbi:hypothetical protein SLNSH_17020 [Alsobacter soli]|uniref:Uncharacterized protein n=1 Tax=Alsobacter soli TaxID=2109933 RepID=A0A2T1HQ75_9HYPH|nr:hypothetical protein [Alsobacter soli]PSC03811.1 hypothetical protein SLNSH_17020 [Alsobacter soli]
MAKQEALERQQAWADAVLTGLERLGGIAHLSAIYRETERIRRDAGYEILRSHEETVRQTLQAHSSGSPSFRGGYDLFRPVPERGRGYWGLNVVGATSFRAFQKEAEEFLKAIGL